MNSIFAERLRHAREHRYFTVGQLARRAAVARQQLHRWENALSLPRLETAARLAQALGCSLDFLAGLARHPHDPPAEDMFGELPQLPALGQVAAEIGPDNPAPYLPAAVK